MVHNLNVSNPQTKAQIEVAVKQRIANANIQTYSDLNRLAASSVQIFGPEVQTDPQRKAAYLEYSKQLLQKYYDLDGDGTVSVDEFAKKEEDGAIKAQLGTPDMRLPIMYALTYPQRLSSSFDRIDWNTLKELTFERPDLELFPNLQHAYTALAQGGNIPCVVNAANEVCVAAFLNDRIKFTDMPKFIERAMKSAPYILAPTLDDYLETDKEIRKMVESWI